MLRMLILLFLPVIALAVTPVNLQQCSKLSTATPAVIGCPNANISFGPVAPTTLVRSIVSGAQGWRAFNTLKLTDQVNVGGSNPWVPLSSITPNPDSTPTPPVTPPVVTPPTPPAVTWVSMNWTCSIANNVATCTAPVTP